MNKNSYFPYIVQTTKRWGIRVFLYQTMQRYIKIVKMHKKIRITGLLCLNTLILN